MSKRTITTDNDKLVPRLIELSRAVAKGYQFEFSMRVPADPNRDADIVLQSAADRIEELQQQVCDECSPDDYGWNYNAVEGRVPCVCIIESGAYQELEAENAILRTDSKEKDRLYRVLKSALERAQHDINWMLNNRQFLSGYVFDYIDKALNQQEGDCRE